MPGVFGALVTEQMVADAGHVASVPGLRLQDTNATLEHWLTKLAGLLGGERPALRWRADITARASHRLVRIGSARLIGGVEGWIANTNHAPLFHDLVFELVEG